MGTYDSKRLKLLKVLKTNVKKLLYYIVHQLTHEKTVVTFNVIQSMPKMNKICTRPLPMPQFSYRLHLLHILIVSAKPNQ